MRLLGVLKINGVDLDWKLDALRAIFVFDEVILGVDGLVHFLDLLKLDTALVFVIGVHGRILLQIHVVAVEG